MAGILDELAARKNQLAVIHEFIESRPKKEREEWLEALRRADLYSTSSILALLVKHGVSGVNENAVVRYRRKLEGYVSAR